MDTFQTIIDIAGAHGAISYVVCASWVCVVSPVIIIIYQNKLTNKYTKNLEFSTRVGTIAHQ